MTSLSDRIFTDPIRHAGINFAISCNVKTGKEIRANAKAADCTISAYFRSLHRWYEQEKAKEEK